MRLLTRLGIVLLWISFSAPADAARPRGAPPSEAAFVIKLVEKCAGAWALPGIHRTKAAPRVQDVADAVHRQALWKPLEGKDKLERLDLAAKAAREGQLLVAIDVHAGGHAAIVVDEGAAAGTPPSEGLFPLKNPRINGRDAWAMRGGSVGGLVPLAYAFPNLDAIEFYVLTGHCGCKATPAPSPCPTPAAASEGR